MTDSVQFNTQSYDVDGEKRYNLNVSYFDPAEPYQTNKALGGGLTSDEVGETITDYLTDNEE